MSDLLLSCNIITNKMSKLSNKDLFILIKTMSMSEKRNFKIFASRHVIGSENNYVSLFDDIEKQKEYDEDALLKDPKYKKHLPTLKTRLYETILKSLDAFHSNSSAANKLNTQIHYAEILFKKGLYEQAEKIISKAKPLALKYECFSQLVDIYNWEIKIMSVRSFTNTDSAEIKSFFEKIYDGLNKTHNYFEYALLSSLFGAERAKAGIGRPNLKYYKDLFENNLYKSPDKAKSFSAKYHYFFGRGFYYFILNRYDKAYEEVKETVELFNTNPHQIPEFPGLYGMALYNMGVCASQLNKQKEALKYLEQAKTNCISHPDSPSNIFYLAASLELGIFIHHGNYKQGLEAAQQITEQLNGNALSKLQNKAVEVYLYHNIAVTCFMAEKYNEAKKWIYKIINENTEMREDLYCAAKILNLIIHYELGNNDLIEYLAKSSYRYLYKKKKLYEFENMVLKFMQVKIQKIKSNKELVSAFSELKQNAEILFNKAPENKNILHYFDFMSWIESKIENKKFSEILKSKNN